MARETDCRIGRVGRIVVGLDVEHSVFEALVGEPGKSGEPPKTMQVKTIGKLRLWAKQIDSEYKELPTLIVRMVKKQVNTLLIPAEIYDTWRLSSHPTYWWSRTLKLSIPRVKPALDPKQEATGPTGGDAGGDASRTRAGVGERALSLIHISEPTRPY